MVAFPVQTSFPPPILLLMQLEEESALKSQADTCGWLMSGVFLQMNSVGHGFPVQQSFRSLRAASYLR